MAQDNLKAAGYSPTSRPDHNARLKELHSALSASIFSGPDPAGTAFFGVAGSINQQLGLAQLAKINPETIESAIRSPFALGYIFGASAWHIEKYSVGRTGRQAGDIVIAAHREALGPLTEAEIAEISREAMELPEFKKGIKAASDDFDGPRNEALSLVTWISRWGRPA